MQPTRPKILRGRGLGGDGGRPAHLHERAAERDLTYMLEGECVARFGDRMQDEVLVRQGDHAFVPADLPHAPCNESGAPCTWVVVHSSGSDQDGIVLLPELDALLAER